MTFDEYLNENHLRSEKKNSYGGFDPTTAKEKKIFKKVDLITLPPSIKGTNCFNCSYIHDVKDGVGYCDHPKIELYVTKRMCCALWDNKDVTRV